MFALLENLLNERPAARYARRAPLVLINGLAEQAESWFRNLAAWRKHFDVYTPNLLAYEGAALHHRIDAGLPVDVDYLVERLHVYLTEFVQTPPYHLVANSLGGKVAVEYAARHPKQVAKLVLLCPSGLSREERLPIVEGVRRSDLKTLVDGVFYDDRPTRHTVAEVEPGVQYALVLTTCAGLWSYMIGDTVCFERRDPPLLRFTGRTKYGLSAFGEHLIAEEIDRAVTTAAAAAGTAVVDYHVGPVFPDTTGQAGRHRFLVEFHEPDADFTIFADELDSALARINEDYAAHRAGNLTMLAPEVWPVRRGGFAAWLGARGKLGGQHKLPRTDNAGRLTAELSAWLRAENAVTVPDRPQLVSPAGI